MSVIISIRFIMFQLQDFAMIEGHLNSWKLLHLHALYHEMMFLALVYNPVKETNVNLNQTKLFSSKVS
jgi:hypothetical protein